jgi:hypothetical protein
MGSTSQWKRNNNRRKLENIGILVYDECGVLFRLDNGIIRDNTLETGIISRNDY